MLTQALLPVEMKVTHRLDVGRAGRSRREMGPWSLSPEAGPDHHEHMRILLLESSPGVGTAVEADLTGTGHEVLRCQPPGQVAFPCVGLHDQAACPLHGNEHADVVLDVRSARDVDPTAYEAGVTCALRAGIPVVVDRGLIADPFEGWTLPVRAGGPAAACELAHTASKAQEMLPLRAEVLRLLKAAGATTDEVDVTIGHESDRTRIQVSVDGESSVPPEVIAIRIHAKYREAHRGDAAEVLDIYVRCLDSTHRLRVDD